MSDVNGWVWDDEPSRQPSAGPHETRDYLKAGKGFAIVRVEHRVLMSLRKPSGQPLLSTSLQAVLLCVLSHINWDPNEQGGYLACWPGTKSIALDTDLVENTVTKHLAALSEGPYIDLSRDRKTRYPGLRIIRRATPDEAAKVREHLRVVGRPTIVWILCHPRDWSLPTFARDRFERQVARLRNRAVRDPRAAGLARRSGGRRTGRYGDRLDGAAA